MWKLEINIRKYDQYGKFINKDSNESVEEGSSLVFYDKSAFKAFKKFTDNYSINCSSIRASMMRFESGLKHGKIEGDVKRLEITGDVNIKFFLKNGY